jgi:16S rRNA (cytosine1402-N4)-methyltransferase
LPKTEERLRTLGYDETCFLPRQMSFAAARSLLHETDGGFDCLLADLGVSSMQLDNPARGFSYKADGPLDLRLNPRKGKPASELLKTLSGEALEQVLWEYADEPHARHIAYAITARKTAPETTSGLAGIVRESLRQLRPRPDDQAIKKSLQRTFMALRIAVNEELRALERFLQVLPHCLKPGGRVAILTFHSGEDRRVKAAFAQGEQEGLYEKVSRQPVTPSAEERRGNPRATCAKLRWAVRSNLRMSE